jgi:glycosyltransferase A (GT-A) superfamily protein (DUF2064 family)
VKTRLHPDFTYEQAAEIAAACLDDTLAAVADLPASRRLLYFDGTVPPASAAGWEVVPQPSGALDERIAHLFDLCDEPTLLIGMDTPHLDPAELRPLFGEWAADAWFGPAADGGYWALGLRHPDGSLVRGIRMSQATTGAEQRRRLQDAGLRIRDLPTLTDVDTAGDLAQAAARAPRLAAALGLVPA